VQLGDLGARAGLAVGVGGGHPSGVGDGQDGLAHAFVGGQADREPDAALPQVVGEAMGGAGGVGPDQDRLVPGGLWQLGKRKVEDLEVILGGVGAGVTGPQQAGQRLAGTITPVQVGQQRVEAEATLVGPGRPCLSE
jgi:hypothetical protein